MIFDRFPRGEFREYFLLPTAVCRSVLGPTQSFVQFVMWAFSLG
jgi:hypothetical protein